MASELRAARLAVLIDADNVSASIAENLFKKIAKIGEASVRRIYGDFSGTKLKSWAEILAKYAIVPQQNFAYTTGKNGSDIALVIDAMDLLHSGRFGGFCLVSSDSDFTRLAMRIREQGINVYCFGAKKTPISYQQACHDFIDTEKPVPETRGTSSDQTAQPKPPSAAIPLLRKVIKKLSKQDGWVHISEVEEGLKKSTPGFDPSTYGQKTFEQLLEKTGDFEFRNTDTGGQLICVKQLNPKASKKAS